MSDDDDNEQAVAFSFSETFDADAWNSTITSQFEQAGAKLTNLSVTVKIPNELSSKPDFLAALLAASLKNVMVSYAEVARDSTFVFGKTVSKPGEYKVQMLNLAISHCRSVGSYGGKEFAMANELFIKSFEKLGAFMKGKKGVVPKTMAAFAVYKGPDLFKIQVGKEFGKGKKQPVVLEEAIVPLVNALDKIATPGKEKASVGSSFDNNIVAVYLKMVTGYVIFLEGDASKGFDYFDDGFEEASKVTKFV